MKSRILAGFLAASESNSLTVQVCGKRKREVGLRLLLRVEEHRTRHQKEMQMREI